jgi:hypothetical protein
MVRPHTPHQHHRCWQESDGASSLNLWFITVTHKKKKANFALEQATEAHKDSKGVALFFL